MYDPNTVTTISGEVIIVERITPLKGMSFGIYLMVKTDTEEISVHLGPAWYVANQDEKIYPNDQVEITGSRITYEGKPAIIAAEIKKGDAVLVLRDENGYPLWAGWRSGWKWGKFSRGMQGKGMMMGGGQGQGSRGAMMYNVNTVESLSGAILEVMKKDSKMGSWKGIHLMVKTGEEEIEVCLGPEWYIQQQDIELQTNDAIKISGSRITLDEKPTIIAAEVKKGAEVLTLRDENGIPSWQGWRRGANQ
ncbi:MAG: hypothetical protein L0Y74_11305 [candidate division Zixibacteria bacterium]|nr:hypothetical protein [candidate division Zixibacteria bacterium]